MGHLSILTSLLSNFTIFNKQTNVFWKGKIYEYSSGIRTRNFSIRSASQHENVPNHLSCEWVFINTMLWDLDSL